MIAADTNIVLRLLLDDDERQVGTLHAIMAERSLFVSLTVLLEVGWVLASRYRMPRPQLANVLDLLLVLDRVEVARAGHVRWAIDRFRMGSDWADVIHLVAASKLEDFATFDKRLARDAGTQAPVSVETLA